MLIADSIFLRFDIPNAVTWFYVAMVLAVALFFKFSRILSFRNLDVITLFLLVPGLLLRQEALSITTPDAEDSQVQAADSEAKTSSTGASRLLWFAYLWLLCGSAYFLIRCLMDLALVRRPALAPNLSFGGMAWLAGALMVCLVAVAYRSTTLAEKVGKGSAALDEAQRGIENAAGQIPHFDSDFYVGRTIAILCHVAVVVGLIIIGWRHFQDPAIGMAAGVFYLILPYTGYHVGQWHHVWPSALMLWAVAAYRRPTLAGILMGLAVGTVYFPALTLPVWLSFYWGRGARAFTASFILTAALCLGVIGVDLWITGKLAPTINSALALSDWQPWKQTVAEGLWQNVHWAYRIPVFIAFLAFLLTTFFWPRPKNLAQLVALSCVLLIGIQFWFADKGGVYVLWYLPLLLLLVFRPNLSDREAPPPPVDGDWVVRLGRSMVRMVKQWLGIPEPVAPVS